MKRILECPVCFNSAIDTDTRFCPQCQSDLELFSLIDKEGNEHKTTKKILYPLLLFFMALSATFITLTLISPTEKHNRKVSEVEIGFFKKRTDSLTAKIKDLYAQLSDFQNQINTTQAELMQARSELKSPQTKTIPKIIQTNPKPETRNPKPVSSSIPKPVNSPLPKPETRNPKPVTSPLPKPETSPKDYSNFNFTDLKDYMKTKNKSTSTVIDSSLLNKNKPVIPPSNPKTSPSKPENEIKPLKDNPKTNPAIKKEDSSW